MENFLRIASICQILVAEFCVAVFLGGFIAWYKVRPNGDSADVWDYVFVTILCLVALWILSTIFRPKATRDVFSGAGYDFCSTHPSYLAIDAMILVVAWFMYWILPARTSAWEFEWVRAQWVTGFAVAFPVLRLVGWFVLRLRPPERVVERAWVPVAMLYGFFVLPITLFGSFVWYQVWVAPFKGITVVDSTAIAGGLKAHPELVDDEYVSKHLDDRLPTPVSRIVKLVGTQVSPEATKCGAYGPKGDDFRFATLRVDLGEGGEALVVAWGGYHHDLVDMAVGNEGKPVEIYGRLRAIPRARDVPDWMQICDLEELPPAPKTGRMLFVVENP